MAAAAEVPQVGQPAPAVVLPSQEGSPINVQNNFKGKWVVLYFYPKDMTQGCTIEAHNFQQDLPKYEKHNAVIVGVSVDSTGSHQEFCAKEGLTFKLLSDTEKKVTDSYGSLRPNGMAARNTFLVDPQGTIRKVFLKVDPNPHSKEVLESLAELQKTSGARVIVLAEYDRVVWDDPAFAAEQRRLTRGLLECAAKDGLATIDSFDALAATGAPGKLYVTWHMNEAGNRLIAGLVAEKLR